jgi:hypothetical protein
MIKSVKMHEFDNISIQAITLFVVFGFLIGIKKKDGFNEECYLLILLTPLYAPFKK